MMTRWGFLGRQEHRPKTRNGKTLILGILELNLKSHLGGEKMNFRNIGVGFLMLAFMFSAAFAGTTNFDTVDGTVNVIITQ
jgi:hypothetical protein